MTFLPVAERELRVAARRKNTYRARFVSALTALLMSGWIYLVSYQTTQPARVGEVLFSALATLAFIYCLLAGTRVTADCLSEEKRDGTLGLLFLTDLKGYDIVLGKLAATSMNSIYGLLAVVPILAISMLMGGVAVSLFWRVVFVLLDTLFLSLSAGLMVSAYCRNEHKAISGTFVLMLLICAGPPALGALLDFYFFRHAPHNSPDWMRIFLFPSPIYAYGSTMESGGIGGKFSAGLWWSLLIIHLLGWICLSLASCRLPHSWQDKPMSVKLGRWRASWQNWCFGDSSFRRALRSQLLNINPFLWLAGRDRLQSSLLWGFLGLLGVGFFWGYIQWRQDWLGAATAVVTAIILHGTLKFWAASVAVRRFGDMRREEALELVMCAPMTIKEILQGQRLGFRRLFGKPLGLILIIDLLLLWMGLNDLNQSDEKRNLIAVFFAGMLALVTDYYAIMWVGLWLGLSARYYKKAAGATVGRILFLPWSLWGLSVSLYLAISFTRSGPPELEPLHFILWWTMLGLATDWIFGWSAYAKLHRELRTAAFSRFQTPRRRWTWLFKRS